MSDKKFEIIGKMVDAELETKRGNEQLGKIGKIFDNIEGWCYLLYFATTLVSMVIGMLNKNKK